MSMQWTVSRADAPEGTPAMIIEADMVATDPHGGIIFIRSQRLATQPGTEQGGQPVAIFPPGWVAVRSDATRGPKGLLQSGPGGGASRG